MSGRTAWSSSGLPSGNDIDTAPRTYGSARLGWDIVDGYRAELEWVHMAAYFLEPDNNREYDGHDLVNIRLMVELTPNLFLGLRGINLMDIEYAERADFGFGEYCYFVGEPRGLYAQLEYQLAPISHFFSPANIDWRQTVLRQSTATSVGRLSRSKGQVREGRTMVRSLQQDERLK